MAKNPVVHMQVYPYDEVSGNRSGTSSAGKPYSFHTQLAVIDAGDNVPPVVFKIQHNNRSDVLAPGWYDADLAFFSDKYQSLQLRVINFRATGNKPQAIAS
ncbi:single-stranded DNA-binding protein [Acidithiobacillus thiooxidans]|uniref:single-stranded DNA-binding protein n=1 Tax=Acidithiobacillus thiooxidans TaxID=930 RepID=UPI0004E0EB6E|nr:single-stranded DNA-binding protein [Acidithiobacillus thiooxidans]